MEIVRWEHNRGKIGLGVLVRVQTAFQLIEICQMNRLRILSKLWKPRRVNLVLNSICYQNFQIRYVLSKTVSFFSKPFQYFVIFISKSVSIFRNLHFKIRFNILKSSLRNPLQYYEIFISKFISIFCNRHFKIHFDISKTLLIFCKLHFKIHFYISKTLSIFCSLHFKIRFVYIL